MAKKLSQLSPAARRKRVARLIKNPGTRAAVPTKYLPPALQAKRKLNERVKRENETLYNPTALLSGKDLRTATKTLVDAQINPALQSLDRERNMRMAQGIGQAQRMKDYQGLTDLQGGILVKSQEGASQRLAAQLAGINQQAQDRISTAEKSSQEAGLMDERLRGEGLDAGMKERLAAEFGSERARAAGIGATTEQQAATHSSAWEGLARASAQAGVTRGNEAQSALATQFANQLAEMGAKRQEIEDKRGPLTMETLTNLRNSEFEKAATSQALGLDAQKAALDAEKVSLEAKDEAQRRRETARHNRASERNTRIKNAETRRKNQRDAALARRKFQLDTKKFGLDQAKFERGGRRGETPAQRLRRAERNDKFRASLGSSAALGRSAYGKPRPTGRKDKNGNPIMRRTTYADIKAEIMAKYGDEDLGNAAMDLIIHKRISRENIRRLNKRNIAVPKRWR